MSGHPPICQCPVGASAQAIACTAHTDHPYDPNDLARCLDYCRRAGITTDELRERMAGRSPQWDALLPHWDHLAELLALEGATRADRPATFVRMRSLLDRIRQDVTA